MQASFVVSYIPSDKIYHSKLRSILGNSSLYHSYSIRSKTSLHGATNYLRPILSTSKRSCFHPGISSISTNNISLDDESKKVTSSDMLRAMLSYIWPKVIFF